MEDVPAVGVREAGAGDGDDPRFWLFTTGGIISGTGGRTTLRLSVPPAERDWWWAVLEKILSVCPNCNPVPPRTLPE